MNDTFSLLQKYTGISKYSQSEVITPQWVVSDMVDLLPQEIFNPDATFFDPAVKSGRFLIEIYNRLMASDLMKQAFPNEQDCHKHIIEKQLFGFATSPTAATVVRKTLYDDPLSTGNIRFTSDKLTNGLIQGAFSNMKFDVVIGNPPYNNDIYLDFVTLGHQLSTQYSIMITPAKWQAKSGDKNEKFRKDIVPYMSKIVYYPDCGDIFDIGDVGGVSYYCIKKVESNDCTIISKCYSNKVINNKYAKRRVNFRLACYCDTILEKLGNETKLKIDKEYRQYNYMITTPPAIGGAKGSKSFLLGNSGMCQCIKLGKTYTKDDALMLPNHYSILCSDDTEEKFNSKVSYIYTRFIRFLVFIGLTTQSILTEETWRFVPDPGAFDHIFTDDELYKKYGLTPEEINIIESVIKERK